jgi:hypothetical protein
MSIDVLSVPNYPELILDNTWRGESHWTIDTLQIMDMEDRAKLWRVGALYQSGYAGEHPDISMRLALDRLLAQEVTLVTGSEPDPKQITDMDKLIRTEEISFWVRLGSSKEYVSQSVISSNILKLSGVEIINNLKSEPQVVPILSDKYDNQGTYAGPVGLYLQARQ